MQAKDPGSMCVEVKVDHLRTNSTAREVGSVVHMKCQEGYKMVGENLVSCTTDLSWSPRLPRCEIQGTCIRVNVEHLLANGTERGVGSTLHMWCEEGFKLAGENTVSCSPDLLWSPRLPKCLEEEESSSGLDLHVLVIICVVATTAALFVIGMAIYMLCHNCRNKKEDEKKEKELDLKMKEIGEFFNVTQDPVGMPAWMPQNMDSELKGRPHHSHSSLTTEIVQQSILGSSLHSRSTDKDSEDRSCLYMDSILGHSSAI